MPLVYTKQHEAIGLFNDFIIMFPENDIYLLLDFFEIKKDTFNGAKKRGYFPEQTARRIHDATNRCYNLYPAAVKTAHIVPRFQKPATILKKKSKIWSLGDDTPIYITNRKRYVGEALTRRRLKGCTKPFKHTRSRTRLEKQLKDRGL